MIKIPFSPGRDFYFCIAANNLNFYFTISGCFLHEHIYRRRKRISKKPVTVMVLLLVYGTTNAQQTAVREDAFTKFASGPKTTRLIVMKYAALNPATFFPLQTVRILDDSTVILSRKPADTNKTGIFISVPANDQWKFSPAMVNHGRYKTMLTSSPLPTWQMYFGNWKNGGTANYQDGMYF